MNSLLKSIPIKWWIIIAVVFSAVIFGSSYYFALNSDANRAALNFLRSSEVVKRYVGVVNRISLKPYSYSVRVTMSGGKASLLYSVDGDAKDVDARVILNKVDGRWAASSLEVEGRRYQAEQ